MEKTQILLLITEKERLAEQYPDVCSILYDGDQNTWRYYGVTPGQLKALTLQIENNSYPFSIKIGVGDNLETVEFKNILDIGKYLRQRRIDSLSVHSSERETTLAASEPKN